MKKYDIVSIGHITNDVRNMMGNKTPFTGGAAYFSPFAAKRTGASVLVITKMAAKDKPLLSALTETGIDVLCLDSAHTTSIENAFSLPIFRPTLPPAFFTLRVFFTVKSAKT